MNFDIIYNNLCYINEFIIRNNVYEKLTSDI